MISPKICGLEGLPATGKSSVCRMLPAEMVSDYAGSDVGQHYPPLLLDPLGRYRITLNSLLKNSEFFTTKEVARTGDIFQRGVPIAVLERTWISQIVFTFAVTQCLSLPDSVLRAMITDLEENVRAGKLYFPSWLVMFRIPERTSYRKVIRRDGRFFGKNMTEVFSTTERAGFLAARTTGYQKILQTCGLPIVILSYKAHPTTKIQAVTTPPMGELPDWRAFFRSLRTHFLRT